MSIDHLFDDPILNSVQLDGLLPRQIDDLVKARHRLTFPASLLVPLNEVFAFRMTLDPAGDLDLIANNFAVFFECGSEAPDAVQLYLFENVDAVGVLSRP